MFIDRFAAFARAAGFTALLATAAVAASSSARADVINFGDYALGGSGGTVIGSFSTSGGLTQIAIGFDYDELSSGGSWASDLLVRIEDPSGDIFQIGGYDENGGSHVSWVFQGGGSTYNGYYADFFSTADFPGGGFADEAGTYEIYIENDWSGSGLVNYENFTIAYLPGAGSSSAVSEPGALALFGVGLVGLGLSRRRRSS